MLLGLELTAMKNKKAITVSDTWWKEYMKGTCSVCGLPRVECEKELAKKRADPLKEGSTLTALCGVDVPKAKFSANIDCLVVGYSFALQARRGMCRKCWEVNSNKRFWYVMSARQEARDEEEL